MQSLTGSPAAEKFEHDEAKRIGIDGMCGLIGFWTTPGQMTSEAMARIAATMASAIIHRGPDAGDVWYDPTCGVALGHRRLAILDLSAAGAQPMQSASGRYVLVYNGEIYNHHDLREELNVAGKAPAWRGHSDTETLLAGIEVWGLEATLRKAYGMFALALWDVKERAIFLARDRIGEKPLYYGRSNGAFLLGSELKAFAQFPDFAPTLDAEAIDLFLALSYVPAPRSIFAGIHKLLPGHIAKVVDPLDAAPIETYAYWSLDDEISNVNATVAPISFDATVDMVEAALRDVVASQMISDVPIGAFLSGGIDSSLVTALMADISDQPVQTFSIGFEDPGVDESVHAAQVAAHFGTRHSSAVVTDQDALDLVPHLPMIYDEPFADSSQLPTALLCRMARQELTVCLSGDGGDEMFAGYNRHVVGPKLWHKLSRVPVPLRKFAMWTFLNAEGALMATPGIRAVAERSGLPISVFDKIGRFADAVGSSRSFEAFYRDIVTTGGALAKSATLTMPGDAGILPAGAFRERMMRWDAMTYLPDDIMVKVDRAAMHFSLETRAPFLDARMVEVAWRVKPMHRTHPYGGKSLLKALLYRRMPRELIDRPKRGFSIPLNRWLNGELEHWAGDLVGSFARRHCGTWRAGAAAAIWEDQRKGRHMAGDAIYNIASLEAWMQYWTQTAAATADDVHRTSPVANGRRAFGSERTK